jgi:hypothetical protein
MTVMDRFVVLLLHKELSSSGLTGRSSTPRLLDSITGVSGILGRPVKPGDDDCGCGALVFIATDSIFKQPDNFRCDSAFPRRDAPEFLKNDPP